jgi:hypothetical protein
MIKKRLWIALMAIPICLAAVLAVGAEKWHQAQAGAVVDPACTSPSPCIEYDNNSTGPGIRGVSLSGNGIGGVTKFDSTSSSNGKAGLFGNDTSTSGVNDSGVSGTSARGNGLLGTSNSGPGVKGVSTNSYGVFATSTNQSALFAQNTGNQDGIQSIALGNDGTNSSTQNRSAIFRGRSGVWGHDDSTDGGHLNVGVTGSSTNGTGVTGSSTHYVGVNAVGGGTVGQDFPALSVVGTSGAGNSLVAACVGTSVNPCDSFHAVFVVDGVGGIFTKASINADGNVDILGQYQVNGSCVAGCAAASANIPGRAVTSYSAQQVSPTIEDFGESELVSGQAYVRLNADFANVIDQQKSYLVFITPEGPNHGLYVTQKSVRGFAVRENPGGQSTLAFSYRIVAKPYGNNRPRLPVTVLPARGIAQMHHR